MVISVGEYGITRIKNLKYLTEIDMFLVYKHMTIDGIPSIDHSAAYNILSLGYVNVYFKTLDQAKNMLRLLNFILTTGEESQEIINSILLKKEEKLLDNPFKD